MFDDDETDDGQDTIAATLADLYTEEKAKMKAKIAKNGKTKKDKNGKTTKGAGKKGTRKVTPKKKLSDILPRQSQRYK